MKQKYPHGDAVRKLLRGEKLTRKERLALNDREQARKELKMAMHELQFTSTIFKEKP